MKKPPKIKAKLLSLGELSSMLMIHDMTDHLHEGLPVYELFAHIKALTQIALKEGIPMEKLIGKEKSK